MITPGENDRLLGWVPHAIRWRGLERVEREFLISLRGRHKRQPGMVLSAKQAAWLGRIVARFQAETLGEGEVVDGGRGAQC